MAHLQQDKHKLRNRIHRLRGQVEAVEKALDRDDDCAVILHAIAACRGAINSLMSEVMEAHIRSHLMENDGPADSETAKAAEELIAVVKTYLT